MRADATKGNLAVRHAEASDNSLVRLRECFGRALDDAKPLGWCHEAIAAEMRLKGCAVDPPYLSKLKSGEKPITGRILDALPDEVEAIFSRHYAESFGQIVITPVPEQDAQRHLAIGLVSLLSTAKLSIRRSE